MIDTLLAFVPTALLLVALPGPDLLFVAMTSIGNGPRAGLLASLGFATGILVHTALVVLGVAAALAAHPGALTAIRVGGAAYLAWIGLGTLRARAAELAAPDARALRHIFRRALIANICNPKVSLFFLAFLPQFVHPAGPPAELQMLLLGATFQAATVVVFSSVALAAAVIRRWLIGERRMRAVNVVTGLTFLALAAWLMSGA